MNTKVHFSSETDMWSTPQAVFDKLNEEFKFNLDPCATKENAKCKKFFTEKENGLRRSWKGRRVFMNPPYGRVIGDWIKKAATGGGFNRGVSTTREDRYSMVARVYSGQGRSAVYQGTAQVRRCEEQRSVPELYSYFQMI